MNAKKIWSMLIAVIMLLATVGGCTAKTATPAAQPTAQPAEVSPEVGSDPITLKVMTWQGTDADVEAFNKTLALFNAKFPNVKVDLIYVQDYQTEYKLAFDANEGPDVVYIDDTMQVLLERYNYLMDLTPYVASYGWSDVVRGGIMEYQNARHAGQYFSAAMNNNPRVFWYNTKIMNELNLEIPQTIDELDAVCAAIKNAGYVPFEADPITLLWIMGELVFDYVPYEDIKQWYYGEKTTDAMTDGWRKAAQKVLDWLDKGYFRPEMMSLDTTNAFMMFASGTSAMFYCSANISSNFTLYVDGFVPGAFRFPTVNAGDEKYIVSGAHSAWAVNSAIAPEKLGAALEFINTFFTKEANDIWVEAGYFSSLNYDIGSVTVDDSYRAAAEAAADTNVGFFLDNARTGLLDKMAALNQSLLLNELTADEYASKLNEAYDSLKAG